MLRRQGALALALAAGAAVAATMLIAPPAQAATPLAGAVHYASDIPWTSMTNGWGPAELDMSNGGQAAGAADPNRFPLTLGGTVFAKGIGAHAPSNIVYTVGGECKQFASYVGVDDGQAGKGHVIFNVLVDGAKVASVEKSGGQQPSAINLDISGAQTVTLNVDPGPEGNGNDHSDWAAVQFNCTDGYVALPLIVRTVPGSDLGSLVPGQPTSVIVDGLAPQAQAKIRLGDRDVATVTADDAGSAKATFVVPSDMPGGTTKVTVTGAAKFGATATGSVAASVRTISKRVFYLDCSAPAGGDGSADAPFSTTADVNAHGDFLPGESIRIKRGTTCTGALTPTGSGAPGYPIVISPYGEGDMPTIAGAGAVAAVRLTNASYWTVQGLHVTNTAATADRRVGILFESTNGTPRAGVVIDGNHVEDVAGWSNKTGADSAKFPLSAGIMVAVTSGTGAYDGITITGNRVNDTGGGGIKLSGDTGAYHRNVYVAHNDIRRVGGDPIVIHNSDAPLVEYNVAYDAGLGKWPYIAGNFAGMWPYNSKNPTFQYNVVGNSTTSVYDATAWDCDISVVGTCLFQYNYSFGNGGGFYLDCVSGCGTASTQTNVILRYNVAQDDCRLAGSSGGPGKHYIYNNTFYCPSRPFQDDMTGPRYMANNIVVAPGGSFLTTGAEYRNNAYSGGIKPPATETGALQVQAGLVAGGSGQRGFETLDGYALRSDSPLLGAGVPVADNGGKDLFGNAVPAAPNIGAYQGAGVAPAALPFAKLVNQVAVTADENPRTGAITSDRRTFSADALAAAGLAVGSSREIAGVPFTFHPGAVGSPDVVKAAGQEVAVGKAGQKLLVVGYSTGDASSGTFRVHYADGSTQDVSLTLPSWQADPASGDALATAAYANRHTQNYLGTASSVVKVTGSTTAWQATTLLDETKVVTSVTLPDGSPFVGSGLSLFGLEVGGPHPASVTISGGTTAVAGANLRLSAKIDPAGATQKVLWSSSDPAIATLSADGVLTASAEGSVTVTATSAVDAAVSVSAVITVLPAAWSSKTAYPTGARVSRGGAVWVAQWYARAGDTPGSAANGPWAEVGAANVCAAGTVPTWTETWIHDTGDRVFWNGHVWQAKWWTRGDEPGKPVKKVDVWQDTGSC